MFLDFFDLYAKHPPDTAIHSVKDIETTDFGCETTLFADYVVLFTWPLRRPLNMRVTVWCSMILRESAFSMTNSLPLMLDTSGAPPWWLTSMAVWNHGLSAFLMPVTVSPVLGSWVLGSWVFCLLCLLCSPPTLAACLLLCCRLRPPSLLSPPSPSALAAAGLLLAGVSAAGLLLCCRL